MKSDPEPGVTLRINRFGIATVRVGVKNRVARRVALVAMPMSSQVCLCSSPHMPKFIGDLDVVTGEAFSWKYLLFYSPDQGDFMSLYFISLLLEWQLWGWG